MITAILSELILQCSTSDFFKCTCGNNNNLNFLFYTIFQYRFNNVCRYSKKSKINLIRNILYSLISCKSGNFICSWIYRINLSFISPCQKTINNFIADFCRITAGSNNCNGFWDLMHTEVYQQHILLDVLRSYYCTSSESVEKRHFYGTGFQSVL